MLSRRSFLAGLSAAGFITGSTRANPRLAIQDAYSIWYNRPSILPLGGGRHVLSSISSKGEARISQIDGRTVRTITLSKFDAISDHGTPAIAMNGSRIIYAIANHWSPLFVGHLEMDNWSEQISSATPLDDGWCTYPSLVRHRGDLLLFYTTGYRDADKRAYRDYVVRLSRDGGRTWSTKETCIPAVPGNIPYPVPPFEMDDGRLWIVFSNLIITAAREMPTEHIFLRYSDDGGHSWIDPGNGRPAWASPKNVMFQVYDACPRGRGIRAACLCADGRWGDEWSRVDAHIIDLDLVGGGSETRIENVSWQQYPNGVVIRRDDPDRVLVAQRDNGSEVIGEWSVSGNVRAQIRTLREPGGLVFPFQGSDGSLFAHTNYLGRATRTFYADILQIS